MAALQTLQQRSVQRGGHAIPVYRVEVDDAVSVSMQTLDGQAATSKHGNIGDDDVRIRIGR